MKVSEGFRDAIGHESTSVSDADLKKLEELFQSIADSIAMARRMIAEAAEKDTCGLLGQATRKGEVTNIARLSLDEDEADVENALTALFNGTHPGDFDDCLRERLMDHFAIDGWVAAGVFVCLLRHPGQYISHDQLARAAGVQSTSSRVIRVYVCHLRACLEGKGLAADGIETGRGSYRIVRSAAFEILNAIASD